MALEAAQSALQGVQEAPGCQNSGAPQKAALDAWDLAEIENAARAVAHLGKRPANDAYHAFGMARGWHGTRAWIDGREAFRQAHRKARWGESRSTSNQNSRAATAVGRAGCAMGKGGMGDA